MAPEVPQVPPFALGSGRSELRPQLVIHPGGARQEVLQRTPIVLGRAPDCDVVLDDETVSRCHCRLSPAAGDNWQVEDLGSRGGTFLDGEAVVEPAVVPFGSWLRIGATVIQLVGREEGGLILSGEPIRDALLLGQLLDALGELAQAYDLEETLRALVDSGIRIGGGERGALFLSTAQDRLEVALARDLRAGDLSLDEVLTRSLPRRAVQANRPVVLADAGAAGREQTLPPSLHHSRRQSVVCVPLPGPDGARGVLYVDSLSPATRFGAAELTVLTALAVQASRAIDRAEERRREGEQRQRLEAENAALKARLGAAEPVAECAAMRRTLELLRRVAPSEATICLTGETGTGKEVMARHLHRLSGRAERPFIVVDCGALPESLIESELFGHEQGAFTGASRARRGRLREADGGTVLLDEIAEVPLSLQPRLLRFLQHQVVHPIGGQPVPLDVRILCATHRDLEEMVARGAFRQDLYYRLAVLTVEVPALRQRGQDVLLLADHFLACCQGDAEGRVRGFTHEAREALRAHSWPGNVRELEHRIQRGILLAAAPFITHLDLGLGDEHEDVTLAEDVALEPLPAARAQANARFERAYLEQALSRAEGSVSRAATLAGVSRQVIHALIKRHGIERGRFERSDRPRLDV